jgi:methyl-accepting chemotaxis protein
VGELVAEIAAASNEQAQGIEQVNRAVAEMNKVVQQTAAHAEESASASEEMNAQAEQMKVMVGELVALVGGNSRKVGSRYYAVSSKEGGRAKRVVNGGHKAIAAPAKKAREKEIRPAQVIPVDEGNFKDF